MPGSPLANLAITFPKAVKIQNTRIVVLYWIVAVACVFFVGFTTWTGEQYLVRTTPVGRPSFWIANWDIGNEEAAKINAREADAHHCTAVDDYDFCFDKECTGWTARNIQCVDLCTDTKLSDCMDTMERYTKEESNLFIPTYYREETVLNKMDEAGTVKKEATTKWRMVKGSLDMGIGFDHEYSVAKPGGDTEIGTSNVVSDNTKENLLTVLLDQSGTEIDRWEPGGSISLSMTKVLEVAGIDLDEVRTELGQNAKEGAKHSGVHRRVAGLKLDMNIRYHNKWDHSIADWPGPVALISITTTHFPTWMSRPYMQVFDAHGSKRLHYMHGIQIKFTSSGSFAWFNLDNVIGMLTSMVVFMGVAKNLVFIFSTTFLGVISQVYKGFLFQECNLGEECCALASRLCSHTSTFVELKDRQDGISKPRILKRFRRIFKPFEDELDDEEVVRFTDFVWKRIRANQGHQGASGEKDVEGTSQQAITVEGFSQACSHGEPLKLRNMITIFDANRKKTVLENFFAGPSLKEVFKMDKVLRTNSGLSPPISPSPGSQPAGDTFGNLSGESEENPNQEIEATSPEVTLKEVRVSDVSDEMDLQRGRSISAGNTSSTVSPVGEDGWIRDELSALKRSLEAHDVSQRQLKEEIDNLKSINANLQYQSAVDTECTDSPVHVGKNSQSEFDIETPKKGAHHVTPVATGHDEQEPATPTKVAEPAAKGNVSSHKSREKEKQPRSPAISVQVPAKESEKENEALAKAPKKADPDPTAKGRGNGSCCV